MIGILEEIKLNYCINCGEKIVETAEFCTNCGTKNPDLVENKSVKKIKGHQFSLVELPCF